MTQRKYTSELCVNMLCSQPVLIQPHNLGHPSFLEYAVEMPFHIYMICRRPRITFETDSLAYQGRNVMGEFIVHEKGKRVSVPFTVEMPMDPPLMVFKCDYPHSDVKILDENGRVVIEIHASHLMCNVSAGLHDMSQMKHLDLEVLYVGQAYGKDGERTAPDRLKNHETLLEVYQHLSSAAPLDEVWIALLHFEDPFFIISFDGRDKSTTVTGDEDAAHFNNVIDNPVSERQRICFAEAAIIRHFQPQYNNNFKYNFPNPAHGTYASCYELDLNAVAVEVQFEELFTRMYSHAQPPVHTSYIKFPLHDTSDRKSMFDFGFSS